MKSLVLCMVLIPHLLSLDFLDQWITWNVGQGLFSTLATRNSCLHFDFGGEVFPNPVLNLCQNKINYLFLSHEHKDHFVFAKKLLSTVSICRTFATLKPQLLKIPRCPSLPHKVSALFNQPLFRDKNSNSKVYGYANKILFPGDSLKKSEALWAPQLKPTFKYWILAHHGSRTSTSPLFLENLPQVQFAIASSRYKKYGHPHNIILDRLKAKKIPVLKTQDWGHIRVLLNL